MILLQYVRSIRNNFYSFQKSKIECISLNVSIDFTNSVIDLNLFVNIYLFAVQPHKTLSHLLGNEMQCSLTFLYFANTNHFLLFICLLFTTTTKKLTCLSTILIYDNFYGSFNFNIY